jgi:hypothetical protein
MRYVYYTAGVVLALALLVPGLRAQQRPGQGLAKTKEEATDKMLKAGELTGKLTKLPEGDRKYFTLQVKLRYVAPNANGVASIQQQILQTRLANMTPAQKAQKLQELNLQMAKELSHTKEESKDIELVATDEMKVRLKNPPPKFDDKGRLRKPTAQELKEAKGDAKLPGYEAELDSLKKDQMVTVTLVRKKLPPPRKGALKDENPDDRRPQVSMIMILAEPVAKPGK